VSKTLKELRQNSNPVWEETHSKHIKNKLKAIRERSRSSDRQQLKNQLRNYFEDVESEESVHNR